MFLEEAFMDKDTEKLIQLFCKIDDPIEGLKVTSGQLFYNWDDIHKLQNENQEMRDQLNAGILDHETRALYKTKIRVNNEQILKIKPLYNELRNEQVSLVARLNEISDRIKAFIQKISFREQEGVK